MEDKLDEDSQEDDSDSVIRYEPMEELQYPVEYRLKPGEPVAVEHLIERCVADAEYVLIGSLVDIEIARNLRSGIE